MINTQTNNSSASANAYHDFDWTGATDNSKEVALIRATRLLDDMIDWEEG